METNPYAAPSATVADPQAAAAGYAPARIWTLEGRIGRLRLVAYWFAGSFLLNIVMGFVLAAAGALGPRDMTALTMVAFNVPYGLMAILLSVRRAHDLGWSGFLGLLVIVPLVNLVLLFLPGTKGANRYGLPPPPNGWGVRLLATIIPAIALVGILAAIAIPAYQSYQNRTQQNRMH